MDSSDNKSKRTASSTRSSASLNFPNIGSVLVIGTTDPIEFHIESTQSLVSEEDRLFITLKEGDVLDGILGSGSISLNLITEALYKKICENGGVPDANLLEKEFLDDLEVPFVKDGLMSQAYRLLNETVIPDSSFHTLQFEMVQGASISQGAEFKREEILVELGQGKVHKIGEALYPAKEQESSSEKRPDQVVFDEETQTYNASLLPYATDQGAPSIIPTDLSHWKKTGANKISHHLKAKHEEIRDRYEDLVTLYNWNSMIYQAKFSFEPVMGETYHLYKNKAGGTFLSMIPPETWKRELVGSFRLNADQIWERLED